MFTSDPVEFAGAYLSYVQSVLQRIDPKEIGGFIAMLLDARERGATVYFIGNGGSAATASHFANDLSIGTNEYDKPFRAISLTDNVAVLTAIGNDFGYEEIFTRQLRALGRRGDVVVGILGSAGNSPNSRCMRSSTRACRWNQNRGHHSIRWRKIETHRGSGNPCTYRTQGIWSGRGRSHGTGSPGKCVSDARGKACAGPMNLLIRRR